MALFLRPTEVKSCRDMRISDEEECQEAVDYLKGMSLSQKGEKGWTLIAVDGCSLGWAKQAGEYLKKSLSQGTQMGFVETPEAL